MLHCNMRMALSPGSESNIVPNIYCTLRLCRDASSKIALGKMLTQSLLIEQITSLCNTHTTIEEKVKIFTYSLWAIFRLSRLIWLPVSKNVLPSITLTLY